MPVIVPEPVIMIAGSKLTLTVLRWIFCGLTTRRESTAWNVDTAVGNVKNDKTGYRPQLRARRNQPKINPQRLQDRSSIRNASSSTLKRRIRTRRFVALSFPSVVRASRNLPNFTASLT